MSSFSVFSEHTIPSGVFRGKKFKHFIYFLKVIQLFQFHIKIINSNLCERPWEFSILVTVLRSLDFI